MQTLLIYLYLCVCQLGYVACTTDIWVSTIVLENQMLKLVLANMLNN